MQSGAGEPNPAVAPQNRLGDRVRSARERRGWNRETLAFHSGVSWSAIAQIETGRRRNLRPATLSALAEALGVSADYLIGGRVAAHQMLEHRALLYGSEDEFVACIVPFLREAIAHEEPALAVTTDENIALLRASLGADADKVEFAARAEWYKAPLSALEGYQRYIDSALENGACWVRVVGEIAWEGLSEPAAHAWDEYEALLNLTLAGVPATIICPYDTRALDPQIVEAAGTTHAFLLDGSGLRSSPRYSLLGGLLQSR